MTNQVASDKTLHEIQPK